ncbi:MAG: ligand-binding sensor domain-containing protein [Salibacteraceae bacterium]
MTLIIYSCNGQNNTKSQVENEIKNIEPYEYNSGDVVTKGFSDKEGNMWFSTTQEGIFKYDGKSFTNYTVEDGLCGNQVWTILEDKDGLMWFGTESGLCKFNGKIFETIPIPKDNVKSKWLKQTYPIVNPSAVMSLIQDKTGIFWIGSNGAGAYKYDRIKFTPLLKERGKLMPDSLHHNVILSIVEDKNSDIWFSSFSHGGISQFTGNSFIHHSLKDGFGDGMVSTLYIDRKEYLWVGTRNGGIYRYNGKSFINVPDTNPITDDQIAMATFFEDSNGIFWVTSYARKGVYQYDGKSFIPFELENSDKLIDIKSISEDRNGNIWFGGRYGNLWRYDGEKLKDYTQLKRR